MSLWGAIEVKHYANRRGFLLRTEACSGEPDRQFAESFRDFDIRAGGLHEVDQDDYERLLAEIPGSMEWKSRQRHFRNGESIIRRWQMTAIWTPQ